MERKGVHLDHKVEFKYIIGDEVYVLLNDKIRKATITCRTFINSYKDSCNIWYNVLIKVNDNKKNLKKRIFSLVSKNVSIIL